MSNNIIHHISDSSGYVTFNTVGTAWPESANTVEKALDLIGPWARTDVGLPAATENIAGISRIATNEAVETGIDDSSIITPLKLKTALSRPQATESVYGLTKYATDAESMTVSNVVTAITPKALNYVFNNRSATETTSGALRVATKDVAEAGVSDSYIMTPLKVKYAIAAMSTNWGVATESAQGVVQLATVQQAQQGQISEGFAISPKTFRDSLATEANRGVMQVASNSDMSSLSDDTKVVTPKKLGTLKASTANFGITKLSRTVLGTSQAANTALSADAQVLATTGGTVTGEIYYNGNKYLHTGDLDTNLPVGSVWMVAFDHDQGNAFICDGRQLKKADYPVLFQRIAYTYGGSGDYFNLPDARGVTVRGLDRGRNLDSGRQIGTYQEDTLQNITGDIGPIAEVFRWSNWDSKSALFRNGNQGSDVTPRHTDWSECGRLGFDASRCARTSHETRMKNIAFNYVIRVK